MRAGTCCVCGHELRDEIEQGLMTGASLASLERRYGISHDSLSRHRDRCMPNRLAEGAAGSDLFAVNTIMQRLEFIQRETAMLYAKSRDADPPLALKALARMEQQLATAVRVREFIEKGKVNRRNGEDIASILVRARARLAAHKAEEDAKNTGEYTQPATKAEEEARRDFSYKPPPADKPA